MDSEGQVLYTSQLQFNSITARAGARISTVACKGRLLNPRMKIGKCHFSFSFKLIKFGPKFIIYTKKNRTQFFAKSLSWQVFYLNGHHFVK